MFASPPMVLAKYFTQKTLNKTTSFVGFARISYEFSLKMLPKPEEVSKKLKSTGENVAKT